MIAEKIDTVAKMLLKDSGARGSSAAVAAILGEHASNWHRHTHGQIKPTAAKVRHWLHAWNGSGLPKLSLVLDGETARVLVEL